MAKTGRNDPCPCGSGKKYKKCCLSKPTSPSLDFLGHKLRQTEGKLVDALLKHAEQFYGKEAVFEAWDEFSLWQDVPMDPVSEPELESIFLPWFLFNWVPDNAEQPEDRHLPEMPIAEHYRHHAGDLLDPFDRRFIEEACRQHFSFFIVLDLVPGKSLTLRDLFCRREVQVWEKQGSTGVRKGDIIYARILSLEGVAIMFGCAPFAIPASFQTELIDARDHIEAHFGAFDQHLLVSYDCELKQLYYDIREKLIHPQIPEISNTDGDLLQPTTLYYKLHCPPQEAFDAMRSLALPDEDEDLLDEAGYDEQGQLLKVRFSWLKKGNKQHSTWNNTLMGHIIIDGEQLTIEVNSQERAEAIRRKVIRRLGKKADFQRAVIESVKKMLEDQKDSPGAADGPAQELMASPEVQAKIKEMADEHWRQWLDMQLPALKNQTPRQAARTEKGRERLEALLMDFQQRHDSSQPFSPDIAALRRSLGLRDD